MIYNSPLGPLKLVATKDGMTAVKYLFGRHSDSCGLVKGQNDHKDKGISEGDTIEEKEERSSELTDDEEIDKGAKTHLNACKRWLDAYFDGTLLRPDGPPKPTLALPASGMWYIKTTIAT